MGEHTSTSNTKCAICETSKPAVTPKKSSIKTTINAAAGKKRKKVHFESIPVAPKPIIIDDDSDDGYDSDKTVAGDMAHVDEWESPPKKRQRRA